MSTLKRFTLVCLVPIGLLIAGTAATAQQLVWSDEFSGTNLGAAWEPMIGDGTNYGLPAGWGNDELQYYTDRPENLYVADGVLHIRANAESYQGYSYTSARIRTKNKADFTYGRIEASIKMPTSKGMWPAFWLLPSDDTYGTWAASGEIDVVEFMVRAIPDQSIHSIHYGDVWPGNTFKSFYYSEGKGPSKKDFSSSFNVFALEWDDTVPEMRWYVNGVLAGQTSDWWSSGGAYPAPFDQRFHLLLNLAVGGAAPDPDGSTVWPQEMQVDWVRVYELEPSGACEPAGTPCDGGTNCCNGCSGGKPSSRVCQ